MLYLVQAIKVIYWGICDRRLFKWYVMWSNCPSKNFHCFRKLSRTLSKPFI